MPIKSIDDLPESIRKALPNKAALSLFLAAFNAAFEQYGDDERAMKVAWSAVKKKYHKVGDTWEPISNMDVVISNAEKLTRPHDAILQVLDRRTNGKHFFSSDSFRRTVDAWNNVPVIMASQHPPAEMYDFVEENPYDAAEKIGGKVVGYLSNSRINEDGARPLLVAQMNFDEGIDVKGLSLSTGFRCKWDNDFKLIGNVAPNHVLVFREDDSNQPRDKGAMILNMEQTNEEGTMSDDKELIEKMAIANKEVADFKEKLTIANKEIESKDETIANMETAHAEAIANKDTEIKELNEKLAVFQQKERDTKWEIISNKIKPGLMKEKGDELRKEFEEDPQAFAMKLPDYLANAEETNEEGEEFANMDDDDAEISIGDWDATEGTYV